MDLFLRKWYTEKRRHIFRNLINCIVAILFTVFVVSIPRSKYTVTVDDSYENEVFDQDYLATYFRGELINKVYYTPQTDETEDLIEAVRPTLSIADERVQPVNSENELELALLEHEHICYGISFYNASERGKLQYTIRTKNNNFRTDTVYSRDVFYSYKKRDNEYIESGFLALQNAIDRAYVSHVSRLSDGVEQQQPSISYGHILVDSTRGPQGPTKILHLILVLAVCFTAMSTYVLLLPMVEERANGMKEYIKIATAFSYWNEVALFVINFLQFWCVLCICIFIQLFYGVWDTNPAQLVYLFLMGTLFVMNVLVFTFFLSTTLESTTVATAVAPVVTLVPLILSQLGRGIVLPLCIFPVNGLYFGGRIFDSFQSSGHLFEAHDLFTVGYPGLEGLSLFHLFAIQLFGVMFWIFLWFYISNVFPGRYGTPKSKCFFFYRSYWQWMHDGNGMRSTNKITAESQHDLHPDSGNSNELANGFETISLEYIDQVQDPLPVGRCHEESKGADSHPVVYISKLNKVFNGRSGMSKVVVKDFSLSIYQHSITVLLGHNGAGKTTTMNIITGILPRTSGTIVVDGDHNLSRYRQKIGFCPQHNVFFSYFNCREHLEFFGRLRGLNAAEAEEEARVVLEKVNLLDKSEALVHTLSGGMQRRLSLAMAIVGHTKLFILDEPTSGLDPESRRDIWDVLLKLRTDHTILLTTHFMEEADALGDWVAIMEDGELVAFGSPLFLKIHYGKGYTLKLLKTNHFDERHTLGLIQEYIPGAMPRVSVQEVFAVTLPYDDIRKYSDLLKVLETEQHNLGIETIGIANATLEEVFLNASIRKKTLQHHPESADCVDGPPARHAELIASAVADSPTKSKTGPKWFLWQTMFITVAIWGKKWIHTKSNKHIYGWLLSLPLLATIVCFTFAKGVTNTTSSLPAVSLRANGIQKAYGILVINRLSDSIAPLLTKDHINSDIERSPIEGLQLIVQQDVSFRDAMKHLIEKDYTGYRDRLVVAMECNITNDGVLMTVLYNNNLVHSAGIAESVATTLLLRYYSELPQASVEVQNIPSTRRQLIDIQTPFFFTELISLAYMFYILVYLQVPLQEHLTGFKQLQNINRYVYWGSTYAYDLAVHVLICVLVMFLVDLLDRDDALSASSMRHIVCVLLLYGMVALPVVYIISQCVESANTAISIMSHLMFVGVGGVFLLSNGYDDIKNNAVIITLMHLVPEFALKHSMRVVYEDQKLILYDHMLKQLAEGHRKPHDLASKHIYPWTFYCTAPFLLIMLIIVLNEIVENIHRKEKVKQSRESAEHNLRKVVRQLSRTISREPQRSSGTQPDAEYGTDETDGGGGSSSPVIGDDVGEESDMVQKLLPGENKEYAIVVKGLRKVYANHAAVKSVSFAVKKGECFGLLGMNGAGKTTVFQMLSQNLPISDGKIYLEQREVNEADPVEYRRQYGYCPQLDVLLDFMTVYEVIDYFAQLKNLSSREKHIIRWLLELDILEYKDHALRECSGGTKRKVNTILALLGGPSVVLLDEPTTGVDPKSRQFLWNTIKTIQRKEQTILLTSHSMDECEELCNRLSIMVNGTLRCIGTIPQLKQRHGKGYSFLLKLKVDGGDGANGAASYNQQLIGEVKERFYASLQEEHKGLLKFIISPMLSLSEVFKRAIALKDTRGEQIIHYSISESSLEDIFLNFQSKKGTISETLNSTA